jgi:hypothetical protein
LQSVLQNRDLAGGTVELPGLSGGPHRPELGGEGERQTLGPRADAVERLA